MELPHSGTVPLAGHVGLDELERLAPGVVEGEGGGLDGVQQPRPGVHLPDDGLHGRRAASASAWTTRSGPSATTARSSSVTRVAISTMTWRAGSSPVISRSIHTSTRGDANGCTGRRPGPRRGRRRARAIGSCGARGAARPPRSRPARAFLRAPGRRRGRPLRARGRRARPRRRPGARAHRRRRRPARRATPASSCPAAVSPCATA